MKLIARSPRRLSAAITRGLYGLTALVFAITAFTPLASAYVPETGSSPSILPSSIGTIGDSISVGYNTVTRDTKTVANNWATGSNSTVNSIARRIATAKNTPSITVFDKAVAGKESAGIGPQVTAINTANPKLTTFFIGNNDICNNSTLSGMTSATAFRSNVRQALRGISSNIKIVAVGVVDMQNLYEIGRDDADIRSVWAQFNVCTVMLGNPLSTAQADVDRRATVNQRVKDFNTAIKEECSQLANCVYDDDKVYGTEFTKEDLSPYDYFHPSISGQKKIAAAVWPAVQKFYPNVFNGSGEPTGDTTDPSITITAPTSGATISGTYNLTANASDDVDVANVQFYANGTLLGSATEISNNVWRLAYNTNSASNGTYSLTSKATDTSGNTKTSAAVSTTISNGSTTPPPSGSDTTAPIVSIVSPTSSTVLSGTVTLSADASDNVGVTVVKFYSGNTFLGNATRSGNLWQLPYNTTSVPNGTYPFSAKAYDAAGNVRTSLTVNASVNNGLITPNITAVSAVCDSRDPGTIATYGRVKVVVTWNADTATKIPRYTILGTTITNTRSTPGPLTATVYDEGRWFADEEHTTTVTVKGTTQSGGSIYSSNPYRKTFAAGECQ